MANKPTLSVKTVLDDPSKMVTESGNALTRLFRTTLYDLNIGVKTFTPMVTRYLNDPNNCISQDPTARANNRGNLMKELGAQEMTFKNFMKGLKVLGVSDFSLILQIKRESVRGPVYTQHQVVQSNPMRPLEKEEDFSRAVILEDGFKDPEPPSDEAFDKRREETRKKLGL